MHAAVLSPPPDIGQIGLADRLEADHLEIFDNPEDWAAFSRCSGSPDRAAGGAVEWESQVLVRGMHCAACSLTLEQALLGIKGVLAAHVSAASGRASITWSSTLTRPSLWMAAPLALGYQLVPASDAFDVRDGRQQERLALWRWLVAGFCMMQIMMYAAPAYFSQAGDISPDIEKLLRWASWVLALPVVIFSGRPFFTSALRDLRSRSISMDLPVALGIAVTFAVSTAATFEPQGWWGHEVYFDSLSMFVFFLLTGRFLEQRLRSRTADSLGVLMQRLQPSVERQAADGRFERVAVRRLRVGDVMRVLPGEAFAADGTIVVGETLADEALLTGESRPVARGLGAQVMAGSFNLASAVTVSVDKQGVDTRYAQIVALMQRASIEKPRLAVLADKVARPFLVCVLLAAALAAAFWWSTDPSRALMAAVAVLVVTCPCALSLATPTAMLTSAGMLARHGVLVRHLQAIETLANIDTIIFDKTGTLTDATMSIRDVQTRAGVTPAMALQLASRLAMHSLHPVSRALVAAFEGAVLSSGFELSTVRDTARDTVRELSGHGLEGQLSGDGMAGVSGMLRLGSAHLCRVEAAPSDAMQVWLADDAGWIARFELDETVRPDAEEAVASLRSKGFELHVLTGDRSATAQYVANRVGIDTSSVHANCTPQSKLALLQALQHRGRKVLMVGDGLNDGPVLAAANASVAVGLAVPLAQAQADFVMPGAQLLMLPAMLAHARRTMLVVRQNLWWAALYNAICVPLALAGWLPAWLAGLGMALSSLLVIANAARLAQLKGEN